MNITSAGLAGARQDAHGNWRRTLAPPARSAKLTAAHPGGGNNPASYSIADQTPRRMLSIIALTTSRPIHARMPAPVTTLAT